MNTISGTWTTMVPSATLALNRMVKRSRAHDVSSRNSPPPRRCCHASSPSRPHRSSQSARHQLCDRSTCWHSLVCAARRHRDQPHPPRSDEHPMAFARRVVNASHQSLEVDMHMSWSATRHRHRSITHPPSRNHLPTLLIRAQVAATPNMARLAPCQPHDCLDRICKIVRPGL